MKRGGSQTEEAETPAPPTREPLDEMLGGGVLLAPLRWLNGKLRRHYLDRQAFVREGSKALTPVIAFVKKAGPVGASFGEHKEISARLQEWNEEWNALRTPLLTYANQHPSEEIRELVGELDEAVGKQLGAVHWLFLRMLTEDVLTAYEGARDRQNESASLAQKLLKKIREY